MKDSALLEIHKICFGVDVGESVMPLIHILISLSFEKYILKDFTIEGVFVYE